MNCELMLTYDTPHICSMCIKTNQVGKQEVGMRQVQKQKNVMKNILNGRTEVKQYTPTPPPPPVEQGYNQCPILNTNGLLNLS